MKKSQFILMIHKVTLTFEYLSQKTDGLLLIILIHPFVVSVASNTFKSTSKSF